MDPLSGFLSLLRPVPTVTPGFKAGGTWSVRFASQRGTIGCYVVLTGSCWAEVEGVPRPLRLSEGDAIVFPRGRSFRLASDLTAPETDAAAVNLYVGGGAPVVVGTGERFSTVGARFHLTAGQADLLTRLLPPVIHTQRASDRPARKWAAQRLLREVREALPGSGVLLENLACAMLVEILRAHLATLGPPETGWLAAFSNPRLRLAIQGIHAEPARDWTLEQLASLAGLPKTEFAARFQTSMGESALDYCSRWRTALACERLDRSSDSVTLIAASLGYATGNAFTSTFKRVMGISPTSYRTRHLTTSDLA